MENVPRTNKGFPVEAFERQRTPFYYYDLDILHGTLAELNRCMARLPWPCTMHYAVKANANPRLLAEIAGHGLGADLVSGGEIQAAIHAGFKPALMAYSGVGKADWEIRLGLECGVGCFNVESVPELEVISALAAEMGCTAPVAIRVNPDIDAHTHRYITTGTAQSKFGIPIEQLPQVVDLALTLPHVHLSGLHFHIGSQIIDLQPYEMLCDTINALLDHYESRGIHFETINVGGGLGIDYSDPDCHAMPDFEHYFGTFAHLRLRDGQQLHFELGRAVVGACGSLISRVLYVKHSRDKQFVILDAGMTDLIRPALYEAHHLIQNLTAVDGASQAYDVVGPVCESSDVFAHDCPLPVTRRGDLIALRSAGAYGESMASSYNQRSLPGSYFA
ncbi:MAG: diaminopimelate decarboxylase [Muribaculaceae bacterium]|nr:diaminopimelate decarboxylase [Muribaculaceae bacterium]